MSKQNIILQVELREGKQGELEKLNPQEFIPAVIYGAGKDNKYLKIKAQDFCKVYKEAGESNLIDLQIGKDKDISKIIIKDVQRDVVKDFAIHVDFYEVDMTKQITTEIPLNFIGESKAVRELGAELIKNMDAVEVKCLPGSLVGHIDIDISSLEKCDDSIKLHSIILPEGISLVLEGNEAIVSAKEPRIQEEVAVEAETTKDEDKEEDAKSEDASDQKEKNDTEKEEDKKEEKK